MKLVALVHVVAYPILVWLVWTWLGLAESSTAALAGSVALGAVIVAATAWLLATAFDGGLHVRATWVRSLLFVLLAAVLGGVTIALRRSQLWWALAFIIAALLPPLFLRTFRLWWSWRYWVACIVFAIVAGYAPWKLVTWVPATKTLAAQATSMTIRFAIAYLISVAGLLAFASIVRRLAIPREPTPAT
jgi:hypothetical protein